MHERNPYGKTPPDFAALGLRHPFLRPYVNLGRNGRGYIDFKNKSALRALTRALLHEDFGLDVLFPEHSLIPTVALRLNYILWIEDLFKQTGNPLKGLDIGTGASSIYLLLCAKKNGWEMVGTDINPESIHFAKRNVEKNGLQKLANVKLIDGDSIFGDVFDETTSCFDFTICNPPFFSSEEETNSNTKARRPDRPPPSAAKTGSSTELISEGGEETFIGKMILESKQHANRVRIFTTMVGVKRHLKELLNQLNAAGVEKSAVTEFVQGKTMRWGLAWTFDKSIASNLAPLAKTVTPIEARLKCPCSLPEFVSFFKDCLIKLEFKFILNEDDHLEVIGEKNTWSNQRRKRREQGRLKADNGKSIGANCSEDDGPAIKIQCKELPPSDDEIISTIDPTLETSVPPKLPIPDSSMETESELTPKAQSCDLADYEELEYGLHFTATFQLDGKNFLKVNLGLKGGYLGKDGLSQVFQYVKNLLDKHHF